MILFYKIINFCKYSLAIILFLVAIYFTFFYGILNIPSKTKLLNNIISSNSIVFDINKRKIFEFYGEQFRYKISIKKVPFWLLELLYNNEYNRIFNKSLLKNYNAYNSNIKDYYINFVLKNIYYFKKGLIDKLRLLKLRKSFNNYNFDEYIVNYLPFKKFYGLNTISQVLFNKNFNKLKTINQIYCISCIDFEKNSSLDIYNNYEKFFSLVDFVNKNFNMKLNKNIYFKFHKIKIKKNDISKLPDIKSIKTGIALYNMKYYLSDYLINHLNIVNLNNNGYRIHTTFDFEYLKKIQLKLNINNLGNSDKIIVLYYKSNLNYYILGIINLPYNYHILKKINSLKLYYNNKKVYFYITPKNLVSFIKRYDNLKLTIYPVFEKKITKKLIY